MGCRGTAPAGGAARGLRSARAAARAASRRRNRVRHRPILLRGRHADPIDRGCARSAVPAGRVEPRRSPDAPGHRGSRNRADARAARAVFEPLPTAEMPVSAPGSSGPKRGSRSSSTCAMLLRRQRSHACAESVACVMGTPRKRASAGAYRPSMVVGIGVGETGVGRVDLHWLLDRHAAPEAFAETIAPVTWPRVTETLQHLRRWPARSGRWVFVTPLLGESDYLAEDRQLRVGVGSRRRSRAPCGRRSHERARWSARLRGGTLEHVPRRGLTDMARGQGVRAEAYGTGEDEGARGCSFRRRRRGLRKPPYSSHN